jgi:Ca2+/H+ antiporter, TMEM165/GDT1 family
VEAFLVSTAIAALAKIGDKSQLPVLKLAARFRKPLPIILGILAAALLNHVAAAELGAWLGLAVVALLEVVR